MTALITLDAAKQHLRILHSDFDEDIQRKSAQATAIVLNYIKKTIGTPDPENPSIVDWDDTSVPDDIAAAICMRLSKLYDDRNVGEEANQAVALGYLTPQETAILHRWRDPAVA
jgi:hypothetical protein